MTDKKSVFIVGAGPTGLTLAIALKHLGLDVTIIEKHIEKLPFSRAMLINSSSLQLLDKYQVTELIRDAGHPVNAVSVYCDRQKQLYCNLREYTSNKFHPVIISQNDVEMVLEKKLALMGVVVQRNCIYKTHNEIIVDGTPLVEVTYMDDLGHRVKARAHILCGADGFKSSVRSTMQIPFPGSTMYETMVAADVSIDPSAWTFDSDLNIFFIGSVGAVLAIRLSESKIRLAGSNSALRQEMLSLLPVATVNWSSDFAVNHYHANSHGAGLVWLAGDAVHVHSPIGGRGMNMGIEDAVALAHAIHTGEFEEYDHTRDLQSRSWVYMNKIYSYVLIKQIPLMNLVRKTLTLIIRCASFFCGSLTAKIGFQLMTGVRLVKETRIYSSSTCATF